ncbi:MAG: GxxExxY protein [Patescibacteria group bacterium]|nr:GxxExxY protein [Patescibacteria group bacterium]
MYREDLVYKDECYKIVGVLYKVYKELGGELLEKHYQKAVAVALRAENIDFIEQYPIKIYYQGKFIGISLADFLIRMPGAEIILEIKKNENFGIKNIKQVDNYLKATKFKLGILANFTKSGVKYKRIVNLKR